VRVLQVDSGREWRGGQNQVRLLSRELVTQRDVDVRLVTRRGSELARRATAANVAVTGVPWFLGPDPVAAFLLARFVVAFQPAVVHVHDAHALTVARWALRWAGQRACLVATRHVDFHLRPRSLWPSADCIIAVSEAVRGVLLADGVPASIIRLIPEGVDPEEIRHAAARPLGVRRRLGLPDDTPLAVNVAALVEHKDQHTLVRAAAAGRALCPDLHWAIAGRGDLRSALEQAIRDAGVASHVHLLGYVEEADALIREADVLVMSSKQEGLGTVVLNALALGTPVVATAAGGLIDIVPAAWRVPVGDAEALARRVVAAVAERPTVALPDRFTARAMAEDVLALYRSLL
jgi:L-malate glycosyltransferase